MKPFGTGYISHVIQKVLIGLPGQFMSSQPNKNFASAYLLPCNILTS